MTRLISAYIAHDMNAGRERLVREFVAEFRGLSSSGKQKVVLESTGLARQSLSAFVKNDVISHDLACSLLDAMQRESKQVKSEALGVIGKEHLKAHFEEAGCDADSFQYRRLKSTDALPEVYEFAFGYCPSRDNEGRRLVTGINWSPGIINPFRQLNHFQRLDGILAEVYASPVVRYTDRGKSTVEVI